MKKALKLFVLMVVIIPVAFIATACDNPDLGDSIGKKAGIWFGMDSHSSIEYGKIDGIVVEENTVIRVNTHAGLHAFLDFDTPSHNSSVYGAHLREAYTSEYFDTHYLVFVFVGYVSVEVIDLRINSVSNDGVIAITKLVQPLRRGQAGHTGLTAVVELLEFEKSFNPSSFSTSYRTVTSQSSLFGNFRLF
jgi:hypothetical protein